MSASSYEPGRTALMLTELPLPTIGRLGPEFAKRADKEGWPAGRFLGGLLEHELAERAKRHTERHRAESQFDPTKTLASFDFDEVPMLSKQYLNSYENFTNIKMETPCWRASMRLFYISNGITTALRGVGPPVGMQRIPLPPALRVSPPPLPAPLE